MQTELVRDRPFETWGANIEVTLAPTIMVGRGDRPDGHQPSALGRYPITPAKNIEFVHGYNLANESSDWFTFGVNFRF